MRAFHDRLNFACPYCGDSSDDSSKKRANLYWKSYSFHCFNGGCPKPATTLLRFLSDFEQRIGNIDEIDEISRVISESRNSIRSSSAIEYNQFVELEELSVPMEKIESKLGLVQIERSTFASSYLKSRLIFDRSDMFRYSESERTIYIFNLTSDGQRAIGYQVAKFSGPNKYLSFNIEKLNSGVGRKIDSTIDQEKMAKINSLSLFFGILRCDFSSTVTIFEGVIDSLFVRNSIAIAGLKRDKSMFMEGNFRFMLDNDRDGFKASKDLLKARKPVFMWKKYFSDCGADPSIKDLNQFMIECKKGNGKAKDPTLYFTNDPLDLIYV